MDGSLMKRSAIESYWKVKQKKCCRPQFSNATSKSKSFVGEKNLLSYRTCRLMEVNCCFRFLKCWALTRIDTVWFLLLGTEIFFSALSKKFGCWISRNLNWMDLLCLLWTDTEWCRLSYYIAVDDLSRIKQQKKYRVEDSEAEA